MNQVNVLGILVVFGTLFFNGSHAEIYAIRFVSQFYFEEFEDVPATFGGKLSDGATRGVLTKADPPNACVPIKPPPPNEDNETGKWIVLIPRYTNDKNCTFEVKVRNAQAAGYAAAIVHNVHSNKLVPMYAENATGIVIPAVFVGETSGLMLGDIYANREYFVVITGESPFNIKTHLLIPFAIVVGVCFIVMMIFMVVKCVRDRRRQRRHRMPASALNKIPTKKFQKGDPYETCAICLDDYIEGEKLRILPCNHAYHSKCIDPWLTKNRRVCPICKRKVLAHDEDAENSGSDSDDTDDTTPLINSNNRGTQGGTFNAPAPRLTARSVSQQSGAATVAMASGQHSINAEVHEGVSSSSSSGSDSYYRNRMSNDFLNGVVELLSDDQLHHRVDYSNDDHTHHTIDHSTDNHDHHTVDYSTDNHDHHTIDYSTDNHDYHTVDFSTDDHNYTVDYSNDDIL